MGDTPPASLRTAVAPGWTWTPGRAPVPGAARRASAGATDSQSVKTATQGKEVGFDGNKKIKGRKRHLLVDTPGLIVAVVVTAANVDDRQGHQVQPFQCCYPSNNISVITSRHHTGRVVPSAPPSSLGKHGIRRSEAPDGISWPARLPRGMKFVPLIRAWTTDGEPDVLLQRPQAAGSSSEAQRPPPQHSAPAPRACAAPSYSSGTCVHAHHASPHGLQLSGRRHRPLWANKGDLHHGDTQQRLFCPKPSRCSREF